MNKSLSISSAYTYQAKTDRMKTQASELYQTSKMTKTLQRNPENPSYMNIAISKTHISLNRGYMQMKRRHKQKQLFQDKAQRGFEANKFIVFKNLHQFQVNIQSQKGVIKQKQSSQKFYGISTFKGTNKTVNSHQINLHVGDVTVLSLFEGYDGNLAALTLKKKYTQHLLQYFKKRKSSERQASFPIIESSIKYSVEKAQKQIFQVQKTIDDNSGSSLVSVIIHDGIIFAVNCGQSSIYCKTIGNKLIRMAVPHTTNNSQQVDRIVRAGGRLYQTIVNVPFKTAMKVKGPLRIFPSGLTVTRTIGKSLEKSKQNPQNSLREQMKGITNTPQIQYLPQSQVQWIVVVSSKVNEFVKKQRIQQIIQQEMAKRSTGYQGTHASEHVCKRILLQAVQNGATESVSALLITPNLQARQMNQSQFARSKVQSNAVQPNLSSLSQENPTLTHQPRSLKYIGSRRNFVQQVRIQ